MKPKLFALIFMSIAVLITVSCNQEPSVDERVVETAVPISSVAAAAQSANWSEETHSKKADPNYDIVFPQDKVNSITITIDPAHWQEMLADMSEISNEVAGERGLPEMDAPDRPLPDALNQIILDLMMRAGSSGDEALSVPTPMWVPATIKFADNHWEYSGVRFKGNSSLMLAWALGYKKLSFKLDFDQFEDEYPQIDNQRFYGFKQLNLNANFLDTSFMRETAASDLFREVGLVAAETAFYAVYVDYGEGPVYFGLYTLVEEMDDTVIETQLGDDDGNLYKPDRVGATFAAGSFTEDDFVKQSNEDEADWSDIEALYAALHDENRTTDPAAWRTQLEAVFDVDVFLQWLAVSTIIQNWDSYGQMGHNYYLYHHPDTGKLTWIPWDHNEAFEEKSGVSALSLSLSEVEADWPLINYLVNDEMYGARYTDYVAEFGATIFTLDEMTAKYLAYQEMIAPYAKLEDVPYSYLANDTDFDDTVEELIDHVTERGTAVRDYLEQSP